MEAVKVHLEFDARRIYLRGLPGCEGVDMVQSTGHCVVAACIDGTPPKIRITLKWPQMGAMIRSTLKRKM